MSRHTFNQGVTMDLNVMPYHGGDERNAIVDAMADAEHEGNVDRYVRYVADLERIGMEYGDTPARRSTGVDDWTASGMPRPAALADAIKRHPSPHIGQASAYWSVPRRQVGTYAGDES